jgi:hypothetical protein
MNKQTNTKPIDLHFEYQPENGNHEADVYIGETLYKVVERPDDSADNPWAAWDNQPPIVAYGGRNYNYRSGGAEDPPTNRLTRQQIIDNHEALEQIIRDENLHDYWTESEAAEFNLLEYVIGGKSVEFGGRAYTSTVEKLIADSLDDYLTGSMDGDMLDRMAEVWSWMGVPTLRKTLTGHSQGDWMEVLLAATPDWVKQTGIKPDDIDKALESAADVFGAYMFGDVYGCEIVRIEVDEDGEVVGEDFVDSCWGFYGSDHEKSGLADWARETLEHERGVLIRKAA